MVETIQYEVIQKIGKVEIREYPTIIIAYVDDPNVNAFGLLYSFITGSNLQKQKVKMTAPVVSQEIAMTAPVFSETGSLAFVMPSNLSLQTTPEPTDSRVKIREVPSRKIAVLQFSGRWSDNRFEKETKELLEEVAKAKILTKGNVFSMLYNPPFTPGFLRRNEVAIEVLFNQ
jgi:hypothetical protein